MSASDRITAKEYLIQLREAKFQYLIFRDEIDESTMKISYGTGRYIAKNISSTSRVQQDGRLHSGLDGVKNHTQRKSCKAECHRMWYYKGNLCSSGQGLSVHLSDEIHEILSVGTHCRRDELFTRLRLCVTWESPAMYTGTEKRKNFCLVEYLRRRPWK